MKRTADNNFISRAEKESPRAAVSMPLKRIEYFDIAKGIGILAVIAGHTLQNKSALAFIYSFHMPLFFLISGYFFKPNDDSKSLIRKNARQLIVPYLFTCGCVILIRLCREYKNIGSSFQYWAYASFYGSGGSYSKPFPIYMIGAIWFLLALFFAKCIFNCSFQFREKYIQACFIVTIAYIGYKTSQFVWLPFSVQAGMVAIIFLYVGYGMKQYGIMQKTVRAPSVIFASAIWIFCIIFGGHLYMVQNYYGNGLLDMMGAICATYIILLISRMIEKKADLFARILTFYGKNSIIVLCFHLIELDTFRWNLLTDSLGITGTRNGTIVLLIGRILWATLSVIVVNKIPIIKNIFTGKSLRTRPA